jgi:cholesterol transport system auxiliary component
MNTSRLRMLLVAAVAVCGASGCALLSKSAPIKPRYFSPERPGDVPQAASRQPDPPAELRLGRVGSVANLEEMLVFRDSAREVGYYRLRRWTEAPEQYLRRRLARVLFEERGLREVMSGGGPTLDVQLTAFEEVRVPRRMARVQVIVRLRDDRLVSWEETVTVELPVVVARGGDPADASVEAIGKALRAAVDQIADRVVLELAGPPAARVSR